VPEIVFCEDVTVNVQIVDGPKHKPRFTVPLTVAKGRLQVADHAAAYPNLLIAVPGNILKTIVAENLSWDEACIGYWCRFDRSPDIYHAGFWRLLQAPYYRRPVDPPPADRGRITANTVVADLLETHGDNADRILRRHGFYCVGCHHSTHDTLAHGAKHHAIEAIQLERLVQELNQALDRHET